jgi:Domain of unknown function (DUF4615)
MRQLFGDYRTKMAQETTAQLDGNNFVIRPRQPHKSSYFVKKMAIVNENDKNFRFNFDVNKLEGLKLNTDETKPVQGNIELPPSNQEFKFNFNIE